jgi:hypothetical protein
VRKLYVVLSILLLVAAGGWLRLEGTDWNKNRLWEHDGYRLAQGEAAYDKEARLILQSSVHTYAALESASSKKGALHLGYPMFLAACYSVFGYSESPPLLQIQMIQNVLDLSTALLLYAAIKFLLNRQLIAWAVSALYMIHPAFISASTYLASDTLEGFIHALILCCFILFFRSGDHSPLTGLLCGAAFAVGILLHPSVFPFLLLFIGLAGLRCFYTRRNVAPYLVAILCCMLLLAPWLLQYWNLPDYTVIVSLHEKSCILT